MSEATTTTRPAPVARFHTMTAARCCQTCHGDYVPRFPERLTVCDPCAAAMRDRNRIWRERRKAKQQQKGTDA